MLTFNQLRIGSVFKHPMNNMKFIKFANAVPRVSPDKQAPNCFSFDKMHYFSVGANSPVVIVRDPCDCDDSRLEIV